LADTLDVEKIELNMTLAGVFIAEGAILFIAKYDLKGVFMNTKITFWWRCLVTVSMGVVLFGLILVLFPTLTLQGFSLLVYANPDQLAQNTPNAVSYIKLVHAVLGAVMVGWGAALLYVLFFTFRDNLAIGWKTITGSVLAWFIPDTTYSVISGFWQNAVLNVVFLILFAIPLLAMRKHVFK
jgi:hypothetical protein